VDTGGTPKCGAGSGFASILSMALMVLALNLVRRRRRI
jgi:uncharacterized protein (TIGR03382 family)